LHRQQPEKDKQNVDFAPLEKFLRTPMAMTPIFYTSPNFFLFFIKTYNKNFAAPYNLATGYKVNLCTAPDLGGGPRAKGAPYHVHVLSHMCDECHLEIFTE